jgi:hypothetical protein
VIPEPDSIPKPFKLKPPNRLVIRKGGGCLSLFGIPFFAAGVFLTLAGLRIIPMDNSDSMAGWEWLVITAMGLVFMAVGSGLVFGRSWITLDRARGRVAKQWGLLFPIKEETVSIAVMDTVALEFTEGDSDTQDQYPVSLKERNGRSKLELVASNNYAQALQQAAFLASFLRMPLIDSTTDHERLVGPDQVHRFDAYQEFPDDGRDETLSRPVIMKSQVELSESGLLTIVFPSKGFSIMTLSGLVVPAAMLIYVIPHLLDFFRQTDTPPAVQKFFVGFIVLFFVLFPVIGTINATIRAVTGRRTVTVTREGISIKDRMVWRSKTRHIPADDIFGLDYSDRSALLDYMAPSGKYRYSEDSSVSGREMADRLERQKWFQWLEKRAARSKGVIIKTGSKFVSVGAGLPDEEVRYLYTLIREALMGKKSSAGAEP